MTDPAGRPRRNRRLAPRAEADRLGRGAGQRVPGGDMAGGAEGEGDAHSGKAGKLGG